MTWRNIRDVVLALLILGVAYAIWGGPGPVAEVKEGRDGRYVQLDIRDEQFDYACFAYANYGELVLPDNFDCEDCMVSEKTKHVIAADDGWRPMRFAVRRGRVIDVYPIKGAAFDARSSDAAPGSVGERCTRIADDVADCHPISPVRCNYLFKNGVSRP